MRARSELKREGEEKPKERGKKNKIAREREREVRRKHRKKERWKGNNGPFYRKSRVEKERREAMPLLSGSHFREAVGPLPPRDRALTAHKRPLCDDPLKIVVRLIGRTLIR